MRAPHCLLALCCSVPLFAAVAAASKHGDAVLVDEHGFSFLPEPVDHLDFPKTPLGRRGVYRYRVLDLPQVIYPSAFLLEVPQEEDDIVVRAAHPWSHCVIRASLISATGHVFHSRTYYLGHDRAGSGQTHRGRSDISFTFTDYSVDGTTRLPHHLSYTLQIDVLRPSTRPSDVLTVEAFTVVHPKRPNQTLQPTAGRSDV